MTEKVKQEKTENQNKWIYQHENRRIEKINVAYFLGHTFIY